MTGLTTAIDPDGTPHLIESDGPIGTYWTALADARASYQRLRTAGPHADNDTKLANLKRFNACYAAAETAAAEAGIHCTLTEVMGI